MTLKLGATEYPPPAQINPANPSDAHDVAINLIEQMLKLPSPVKAPQAPTLDLNAVVICNQRTGIIHQLGNGKPNQNIKYAGTYEVNECLTIYAYDNQGNRFFCHADLATIHKTRFNWEK